MTKRSGGFRGAKPTWTTTSTSGIFGMEDVVDLKAAGQWPRGPLAPTNLAATAGNAQVALTWTAPATAHGTLADYRVEYSADGGVTWTDFPAPIPVITITSQPTNQTASAGAATFSVTATVSDNSATLSYQWQKQESGAGAFTNISGATSSSLALTGLTNATDDGDVYRCVVSATGGASSVTSSAATLTVSALITLSISNSSVAGVNGLWTEAGTYGPAGRRYWTKEVAGYGTGYIYFKAGWPTDGTFAPHWIIGPALGADPSSSNWYQRDFGTVSDAPEIPTMPPAYWQSTSMSVNGAGFTFPETAYLNTKIA